MNIIAVNNTVGYLIFNLSLILNIVNIEILAIYREKVNCLFHIVYYE